MNYMFNGCSNLTTLDLSNFDTSNVTRMEAMFANCSKLETIYASQKFNTDKVEAGLSMFSGCYVLKGNISFSSYTDKSLKMANLEGYFTLKGLPDKPWVKYENNTLTFYYGYKYKPMADEYNLNEVLGEPGWITDHKTDIKTATFDETFKSACPTSCALWFNGCVNLTKINNISNLNTSSMVSAAGMFRDCKNLTSIDVSHFDTSKAYNLSYMFDGCSSLKSINVSNFDTSATQYIEGIFGNCKTLKTLDVSNFSLKSATHLTSMFINCSGLTTIDISNFSAPLAESICYMFYGCSNLTSINLGNFKPEKNVTSISGLFKDCSSLTSIDLTNFSTENIKDMSILFQGCSKLKSIYVSDKFVTTAVTTSTNMFNGCKSLVGSIDFDASKPVDKTYANADGYFINSNEIKPWVKYENGTLSFYNRSKKTFASNEYTLKTNESSPGWVSNNGNVTKVVFDASFADVRPKSCYRWFDGCSKLTEDNIIGMQYLNTSEMTTFRKMFINCTSIKSLDLSSLNTAKATSLQSLVEGCTNLTSIIIPKTDNVKNIRYMFKNCKSLKEIDLRRYNTSKVELWTQLFEGCTNLKDIYGLEDISTANATIMDRMFFNCSSLTSIETRNFSTSKVTSMANMFEGCKSLTMLNLSNFNTAKLTNMSGMFKNCESLTSLDLTSFNTSIVANMSDFVLGCKNLRKLDITSFNTANTTNMGHMFADCSSLQTLNLTSFNTAKTEYMDNMFNGCAKLSKIYASENFTTGAVKNSADMFLGCVSLKGARQCDGTNDVDAKYANTTNGYFLDKSLVNEKPWVKYENNTLTFYYSPKTTLSNDEYFLNEGDNIPDWSTKRNDVTKVVFDPSFEEARPTNCAYWFYRFVNLTTIEGLQYLNTSEVFTMAYMFESCSNLKALNLSSFETPKLTNMSYMFYYCTNLRYILVSDKFSIKSVTSGWGTFSECKFLFGAIEYSYGRTNYEYATFDGYFMNIDEKHPWAKIEGDTLTFFYDKIDDIKNIYNMNPDSKIPGWKETDIKKVVFDPSFAEARPKTCDYWFSYLKNLNTIEGLRYLNTSKVTKMTDMFNNCSSLKELDLSNFDTSNVTSMNMMFYYCTSLTKLDLSSFNTSNVTSMYNMFYSCSSLKELDLSSFNTSNVTNMNQMFCSCSSLKELDLSSFNTSNVTNMYQMFMSNQNLNKIIISDFSTDCLNNSNRMLEDCHATIYCSPKEASKSNSIFASNKMVPYVKINSKAEYGTLCVPLGSKLEEGSFTGFDKLYTVKEHDAETGKIKLKEATSIEPGVPYVYHRNITDDAAVENAIIFTADIDASTNVSAPVNEGSMLKGTFERITAPDGCYVLQTDGMFHPVKQSDTMVSVGAYRAYLDLGSSQDAKVFSLSFEDNETDSTSGIMENVDSSAPKTYYDLMGRRVLTPRKGQVYITGGKKVVF